MKRFFAKNKNRFCFLANMILAVTFVLADGPVWCRDSNSYVTMETQREPLYCSFLWLMRRIFGDSVLVHGWDLTDREGGKVPAMEPLYLQAAVVIQAAVFAVTVWYLAKVCWEIGKRRSGLAAFLFAAVGNLAPWGVEAVNRFAAKRSSAYIQSILTEGFGISFYILFVLFLFRFLLAGYDADRAGFCVNHPENTELKNPETGGKSETGKYLILSLLMVFLCMLLHKQLSITAIIFVLATLVHEIILSKRTPDHHVRRFFLQWGKELLALCVCLALVYCSEHVYNLVSHGTWSTHTGSADKIDSTLLYTASESDADLFGDDPDLQQLFLQIEHEMEEQHLRYENVPEDAGWAELAEHYADAYDVIGFEVLDPLVEDYVLAQNPGVETGSVEISILEDQICRDLEHGLIHQNPQRLLHLWLCNFRKGFVNTILRVSPVLNWAALVLWVTYTCLLIRVYRETGKEEKDWQKRSMNGHIGDDPTGNKLLEKEQSGEEISGTRDFFSGLIAVCLLASLVLIGTVVNSAVVGAVIFPQTRYMIYNMALFYICGFMLSGFLLL